MSLKLDIESAPMLRDDGEGNRKISVFRAEEPLEVYNPRAAIQQSTRDGNIKFLEEDLIKFPKSVNIQDVDGMTPLHYAARYGNLKAVRLLLSLGAFPNITNLDGDTPLHIAAKYELWSEISYITDEKQNFVQSPRNDAIGVTKAIINVLVKADANINATNIYKLTPLHYAAMKSNLAAVVELLKLNADVTAEDVNEMTPLLLGCVHGNDQVIKLLLNAKSDIRKKDQRLNTVFHIVAMREQAIFLKTLIEKCASNAVKYLVMENNEGKTPLRLSVEGNHPEILKEILRIYQRNSIAWTRQEKYLVHFAASKGYLEIIKELVQAGANKHEKDEEKSTPLHISSRMNQVKVVEYLLEDCVIDEPDEYGMTPLMLAVSQNSIDCVRLLIKNRAQIWLTDHDERTLVYIGAKYNALESVQYVLEYIRTPSDNPELNSSSASRKTLRKLDDVGAMVNKADRDQNTPMHVVASNGYLEMMRLLYEYNADLGVVNEDEETPLHRASHSGQTMAVRQLVQWDPRLILKKDEMGNSALHLAAKMGHDVTTRVLLDVGADKEARNSYQQTPLMVAAEAGRLETIQQLVQKGAAVESYSDSRTVLHLAAFYGYDSIARYLIQVGVTLDRRDDKGRTALDVACEQNKKEVARALLESDDWRSLMVPNDVIPAGNKDKQGNKVEIRSRNTPFRRLLAKFPELAALVMDKCVERNKEENDETLCIAYNFEFIDDTYMMPNEDKSEYLGNICPYDCEFKLQKDAVEYAKNYDYIYKNHPLKLMESFADFLRVANAEKLTLLSHPLSMALLKHKWNKLGRWVYYFALIIYCMFIICLTQFVRHTKAPYNVEMERNIYYESAFFDESEKCPNVALHPPHPFYKSFIILFAISQILKELFQLHQRKLSYLYNWENWVECFIYSTSILTVIDFSDCSATSGVRKNWQWLLAALCIFIGWINLLFMIRKMPRFGIFVVMFVDIVKTFFRFFPIFVLFIIAFSTSFYVILQNRPEFSTIFISPLKTTVMMIGEFEFAGIFHGDENLHTEKMFGTAHTVVAYSLFLFFCIIMTILLMNLLVGLAVDDIKGVQEKAELKRLGMQVELVLQIEASAFLIRRTRRYATCRYGSYPNGRSDQGGLALWWTRFRKRFGININNEVDIEFENEESELAAEIRSNLQIQRNRLQTLQENVDVMYEKQIRLEALIRNLAKGMNINIELEDND